MSRDTFLALQTALLMTAAVILMCFILSGCATIETTDDYRMNRAGDTTVDHTTTLWLRLKF